VETHSGGGRSTAAPPKVEAKPGWFAPKHEKEFYKALQAYVNGETEKARTLFRSASEKDTGGRVLVDDLLAGMLSLSAEKPDEAIPHLEEVVSSEVELPDAPSPRLTIDDELVAVSPRHGVRPPGAMRYGPRGRVLSVR
jgi:hypothetical protein